MNFFHTFREQISKALETLIKKGLLPDGLDFEKITTEPPRDPAHGDLATNAAMILAKSTQKNPRELGELIGKELENLPYVEEVSVAGPGFINLKLSPEFWYQELITILEKKDEYGASTIGLGEKINLEYVSANPTGPIHAGHGRVAIVADVLANLLEKVGYRVLREYYINDAGAQAEKLAQSTYLRYREALGEKIDQIPEGYYPGDYLKEVGQALATRDGAKWLSASEKEWLDSFREFTVNAMMSNIRKDLDLMGISHEVFTSETELYKAGAIEAAIKTLKENGLIYEGILEPPKGKIVEDWEPRPQLLFRSVDFGDDVDRPLQKSNGSWTYFAGDIAYHYDKFLRGYHQMIDVWGADHGGYVKRVTSAVKAITKDRGHLDVIICQIVNFMEGGQPVKMSKRAGTFIEVRDVIEKVGKDPFRFMMITRKSDAHLDFDFQKVLEQTKDNPVFYIQYAHARCHSVMRMAREVFPDWEKTPAQGLDLLKDQNELQLLKLLAGWPRQVEIAALAREPHRLSYYLYEIAQQFHMLWNKGKENTYLRFIVAQNHELTRARLAMIQGVAHVIASGLNIFGVTPVEEMRE
ncbi:MAG: arginine--tRNA ligase [Alphaproteobacteria bacterium 41-28]|nr:MAG: arginine--tRNA ligase [Alphaproteobacteria bacterium 41-28]